MFVTTYTEFTSVKVDTEDWGVFRHLPDSILEKIEQEIKYIYYADRHISIISNSIYWRKDRCKHTREQIIAKFRNMEKTPEISPRKERVFDQYGDEI